MTAEAHPPPTSPAPAPSDREREHGLALLVVLWLIAAGSVLVVSFNASVRGGVSFTRSEVQLSQVEALLDAGVEIAAARLIDEESTRRWRPDGRARTVSFAGSSLRIHIQDPNGLVDLNKADESQLLEFFKQFTANAAAARMIRDRILIARGEIPGQGKAETPVGDDTGLKHANEGFMDVGQLRQIEGVSMDLFHRVAPFLTVYSHDGSINPLTAPEQVFATTPAARDARSKSRRQAFGTSGGQRGRTARASGDDTPDDADEFGPAFVVTVEAASGGKYAAGKTYVIATGLDADLPYRVLSVRPAIAARR